MSLTFNTPHESHVNTLHFTAHKEKNHPNFSYILTSKVKNKICFRPNASQVIHFPIQPTFPLTFETFEIEIMFLSTPHPFFNSRFYPTISLLRVFQATKSVPNSSSVIIQKVIHHSDILSPGYIGYIEVPATNNKPPHYKVIEINSLIHTILLSNYPDLSEPNPCLSFISSEN